MRQIYLLVCSAIIILSSCKRTDLVTDGPASLNGQWKMTAVKEIHSGTVLTKPVSVNGDVVLTFSATNNMSGIFFGVTPSNEIWQNSYYTGADQSLSMSALSMTKVMETAWGNEFVNNIRTAHHYYFDGDGVLNITTQQKILVFKKL